MKQTYKVALIPEVYDFLNDLAQTLLEKDTVNTYIPLSRRKINTPFQQPKPNPAIQTLSLLAIFAF